jgi:hypothetical protein
MRVEFATSSTGVGYFPGLARPVVLESSSLPSDQAEQLRRLVADAGFFALPAAVGKPGVRDARSFRITVSGDQGSHSVTVQEPIDAPSLQKLVAFLSARASETPPR